MKTPPDAWRTSDSSIRAVQIAFEFNKTISDAIRHSANQLGISPSDQIRAIIGLEVKKPKRPRLTISLTEQDYQLLAERYQVPVEDKNAIREAIAKELLQYSQALLDNASNSEQMAAAPALHGKDAPLVLNSFIAETVSPAKLDKP